MDDVILNKVESIEKCIKRVLEEYDNEFTTNYTKQDSILLNLQRICQCSMDIASHIIRIHKFGLPKDSRDFFDILYKNKIVTLSLAEEMKKMIGFRNIIVHSYQEMDLDIVIDVVENKIQFFKEYIYCILKQEN